MTARWLSLSLTLTLSLSLSLSLSHSLSLTCGSQCEWRDGEGVEAARFFSAVWPDSAVSQQIRQCQQDKIKATTMNKNSAETRTGQRERKGSNSMLGAHRVLGRSGRAARIAVQRPQPRAQAVRKDPLPPPPYEGCRSSPPGEGGREKS